MANLSAADARNLIVTYLENPAFAIYNSNPPNATDASRVAADPSEGGIVYPADSSDPATPVANTVAVAVDYATVIRNFIIKYSAIRLCTFEQIVNDYSHGVNLHIHASATVATYQRYCMLNVVPSYHTAIPSVGTVQTGAGLTAGLDANLTNLTSYLGGGAQTTVLNNINLGAGRTFNFCHSSCHSNCHSSGGRNRR